MAFLFSPSLTCFSTCLPRCNSSFLPRVLEAATLFTTVLSVRRDAGCPSESLFAQVRFPIPSPLSFAGKADPSFPVSKIGLLPSVSLGRFPGDDETEACLAFRLPCPLLRRSIGRFAPTATAGGRWPFSLRRFLTIPSPLTSCYSFAL